MKSQVIAILIALTASAVAFADDFDAAILPFEKFNIGWQQSPSKALAYLVSELNRSQFVGPWSTTTVFSISQKEMSEPYEIVPRLRSEGRLEIEIQIHPMFKDNVLVHFDILSDLKSFADADFSPLRVLESNQYARPIPRSVFDTMQLKFYDTGETNSPVHWAELKLNAKAGSEVAKLELAKTDRSVRIRSRPFFDLFLKASNYTDSSAIERDIIQLAKFRGIETSAQLEKANLWESAWNRYMDAYNLQLEERISKLETSAKKEVSRARKFDQANDAMKKAFESSAAKLDDLIKANDRNGVASLLELYFPWAEMGPVERGLWKNWIEAIRHPKPELNVLLYRGIGAKEPVLKFTPPHQAKNSGRAMVSTVLAKNQGNYTRRLRSLTTARYKRGHVQIAMQNDPASPLTVSPKVTSMMINHARSPDASTFLSFTTKPSIAFGFGGREILAVKIDRRRVLPNFVSQLRHEMEMLVPLIVFPDEIAGVLEGRVPRDQVEAFAAKVREEQRQSSLAPQLLSEEISKEAFQDAYSQFARAAGREILAPACKAAFNF